MLIIVLLTSNQTIALQSQSQLLHTVETPDTVSLLYQGRQSQNMVVDPNQLGERYQINYPLKLIYTYTDTHQLDDLAKLVINNYTNLDMAIVELRSKSDLDLLNKHLDRYQSVQITDYTTFDSQLRNHLNFWKQGLNKDQRSTTLMNFPNQLVTDTMGAQYSEYHDLLGIAQLHTMGYTGENQNYTQIDDGIDTSHPAFGNRVVLQEDFSDEETQPCGDHGTAVAGLAVANESSSIVGSAPGARIISIGLGCGEGYAGSFLQAYDYIIAHNTSISVVNTSFGGNGLTIDTILRRVVQAGITVVGSAGNAGPEFGTTGNGGPGNSIYGISVGATNMSGYVQPFSSRGYAHNLQLKPDIVAPGLGLNTTKNGGGTVLASGTSLSAPIVSGAIVSLIDAIQHQGWHYNPGLLKAAVMKGATQIVDITNTNLQAQQAYGHGLLNISKSYDIIQNALRLDNLPMLLELTPNFGPNPAISVLPAGTNNSFNTIELTQIASHPTSVQYSFSPSLDGRITLQSSGSDYNQVVTFQVDTRGMSTGDRLEGEIIASSGNDNTSTWISIEIGEEFRGVVGMDLIHTSWDLLAADTIGGGNTGSMAQLAMQQGYNVIEIYTNLTPGVLDQIDILWMPDPLNVYENRTSDLVGIIEQPLNSSEIEAIHQFITGGGSLFMDFIGTLISPDGDLNYINATVANELLQPYDIQLSQEARPVPITLEPAYTHRMTALTMGVDKITHYGNFLATSAGATTQLVDTKSRGMLATHTSTTGKVVVTTTNFWLDNYGMAGNYSIAGLPQNGTQDPVLARNLWNWFDSEYPIQVLEEISDTGIQQMRIDTTGQIEVNVVQGSDNISIDVSQNPNSQYEISIINQQDTFYQLNISTPSDFYIFEYIPYTQPVGIEIASVRYNHQGDTDFQLEVNLDITDSTTISSIYGIYVDDILLPFTRSSYIQDTGRLQFTIDHDVYNRINANLPQNSTLVEVVVQNIHDNVSTYLLDLSTYFSLQSPEAIQQTILITLEAIALFILIMATMDSIRSKKGFTHRWEL